MEFAIETGYLFKTMLALAGIILLANVLLKKLKTFSGHKQGTINVIERMPVSKSSSLAIVKIGKQYFLMSLNDSSSEILKEFSSKEMIGILDEKESHSESMKQEQTSRLNMSDFRKKYSEVFEKRAQP